MTPRITPWHTDFDVFTERTNTARPQGQMSSKMQPELQWIQHKFELGIPENGCLLIWQLQLQRLGTGASLWRTLWCVCVRITSHTSREPKQVWILAFHVITFIQVGSYVPPCGHPPQKIHGCLGALSPLRPSVPILPSGELSDTNFWLTTQKWKSCKRLWRDFLHWWCSGLIMSPYRK